MERIDGWAHEDAPPRAPAPNVPRRVNYPHTSAVFALYQLSA